MDRPKIIKSNVSLKPYNTWKVGGEAEYFALPNDIDELKTVIGWAHSQKIKINLLGDGSNVLISEPKVTGLTVVLKNLVGLDVFEREGCLEIEAWAGASKAELLKVFLSYKLPPALFLTGLPGNVAGGVVMNAGVAENRNPREFFQIVKWVEVLRFENLEIERISADSIEWTYRKSKGWQPGVITRVGLSWPLSEVDPEIMKKIKQATRNRIQKQPISLPSCGSVFKNPRPLSSGALIDQAGLKGFAIGGAAVSKKHANFIITNDQGTAQDVHELIEHVKSEVKTKHNVDLTSEVVYFGDWLK